MCITDDYSESNDSRANLRLPSIKQAVSPQSPKLPSDDDSDDNKDSDEKHKKNYVEKRLVLETMSAYSRIQKNIQVRSINSSFVIVCSDTYS